MCPSSAGEGPGADATEDPTRNTFAQVYNEILEAEPHHRINIVRAFTRDLALTAAPFRSQRIVKHLPELCHVIAGLLVPPISSAHQVGTHEPLSPSNDKAATASRDILLLLKTLCTEFCATLQSRDLVLVCAFTGVMDSHNDETTTQNAHDILNACLGPGNNKADFITSAILRDYLRPLFRPTRPGRITSSGRKAYYPQDSNVTSLPEDDVVSKPWKFDNGQAINVFAWAVQESDPNLLSGNWHMFTPVLLALLDDLETMYKVQGMEILIMFLQGCPAQILRDTGLGDILEDSLFPTLTLLPSLTVEIDSIRLLTVAYPAITKLAQVRFGRKHDLIDQQSMLSKVLQEGVFTGYWHASRYIGIVEVLARQSNLIVKELGFSACKHLKDLLPMYSGILSDPFIPRSPGCLLAALSALKTTVLGCWPRMCAQGHGLEVLRILATCWLSLEDELTADHEKGLREKIRVRLVDVAGSLFTVCAISGPGLEQLTVQMCNKEPKLKGLFDNKIMSAGQHDSVDARPVAM